MTVKYRMQNHTDDSYMVTLFGSCRYIAERMLTKRIGMPKKLMPSSDDTILRRQVIQRTAVTNENDSTDEFLCTTAN